MYSTGYFLNYSPHTGTCSRQGSGQPALVVVARRCSSLLAVATERSSMYVCMYVVVATGPKKAPGLKANILRGLQKEAEMVPVAGGGTNAEQTCE